LAGLESEDQRRLLAERRAISDFESSPAAASALMQPFDRRAPTARMHLRVCTLSGWNLLQLLR
jgi:hypothetical protein